MKRVFFALALISMLGAFMQPAFAGPQIKYGSKCGLADGYGEDTASIGLSIRLRSAGQLNLLQREQVIATAQQENDDAVSYGVPSVRILSAQNAIDYLNENSEGEEAYISDFSLRGQIYTQVVYYPGGNPVGAIFKKGSDQIIAKISDSDIVCRD